MVGTEGPVVLLLYMRAMPPAGWRRTFLPAG